MKPSASRRNRMMVLWKATPDKRKSGALLGATSLPARATGSSAALRMRLLPVDRQPLALRSLGYLIRPSVC